MKKLFSIIILTLIFGCSSPNNDENNESNSDCIDLDYDFICWNIVDDSTETPIANATVVLSWGIGFGNVITGGSDNDGLKCFCWDNDWEVISGGISAEGYDWMDLTGITPGDISTIKLIPSN